MTNDIITLTTSRRWGTYPAGTRFECDPIRPGEARPGDVVVCSPPLLPDSGMLAIVQDNGEPETFHSRIAASQDTIVARAVNVTLPLG